jgi:hypothetical protein
MDGQNPPSTPQAPQPAAASPVIPVPAPSSGDAAASAVQTPAPVTAPVQAAPAEQPKAAEAQTAPAEKSILGAEVKPVEKPAEAAHKPDDKAPGAPEGEPKKEEGSQSAEPAQLPAYEAFLLPEGVEVDQGKLSEFTKELGELQNLTKAEQKVMQEFGQKLVNRHVAEVQDTVKRLNDLYQNSWEKQKSDWKDAFEKDPEIGGPRRDTTVNAALEFIRTHGGSVEHQQQFRELMDITGVGNHPAMIRMLAKANMAMSEGKPLPGTKPATEPQSKVQRRYGKTTG